MVKQIDIQIVGDDLFTTNIQRVYEGSKIGAANTVLLKVNQIGTISESLEMIQFAYKAGYGIMPCESRGEGTSIADYCVGINACAVREMAIGETANRFLEIETGVGLQSQVSWDAQSAGKRFQSIQAE
jgi:enolase